MIKLGTNNIGKIYLGSNSIGKAYLGSNLVFQKGTSPTPSIQPVFYDHLVFDGTAYINTDMVPPENASFRCAFGYETAMAAQRVFSCQASNSSTISFVLNSATTTSQRNFTVYYCSSNGAVSAGQTLPFSYESYAAFLTPLRFGWGDSSYTFTKGNNVPTGGLVLGDNASHSAGGKYTGRMSIFRIYGSDAQNATTFAELSNYPTLYTLRPCTYDGEAGMWCVETSTFYGNSAGAGTLSVINNS